MALVNAREYDYSTSSSTEQSSSVDDDKNDNKDLNCSIFEHFNIF